MFGRKNNFGFYTMWFLIGGAIGASIALLFAPMSGRKMQKQVKEVLDDQVENLQSAFKKVANK